MKDFRDEMTRIVDKWIDSGRDGGDVVLLTSKGQVYQIGITVRKI